jgi:hypothetical protein
MADASLRVIASAHNCGFGLFVTDLSGDGVHACLAGKCVSQVHLVQPVLCKGKGRPERGGIEEIQSKVCFLEAPQLEQPAVSKIRCRLERPVFAIVVVACDGYGVVRILENRESIASSIVEMAQTEVRHDLNLADQAWAFAEKAGKKLANLSGHH